MAKPPIPFDPANPFPIPGMNPVAGLAPKPEWTLPTLLAMLRQQAAQGQGPGNPAMAPGETGFTAPIAPGGLPGTPAAGLGPMPTATPAGRMPGLTFGIPAERPMSPGADDPLTGYTPRDITPTGDQAHPRPTAPAGAFDPIDPSTFGYAPTPTAPDLPAPLDRNRKGEGANALKSGGIAALLGLLFSHGDIRGALAGAAGGIQGGLSAGDAAFGDAEKQRQENIQAGQVGYQNDLIGANNTNQDAARKEAADRENRNLLLQKFGIDTQDYNQQYAQHKDELNDQERKAKEKQVEDQQRRAHTLTFLAALRGSSPSAASDMLKSAENNKDLDYMGLAGVFKKNADGTFDTTNIAKDSSDAVAKSILPSLIQSWRYETDPATKAAIADQIKQVAKTAGIDAGVLLPSGGGATIVKPDIAAGIASREKIAEAAQEARNSQNAAANALKEQGLAIQRGRLDFQVAGGGKAAKPMDADKLGKYTMDLQGRIARAQNQYRIMTSPVMVPNRDPKTGYVADGYHERELTDVEQRERAAAASRWAQVMSVAQDELNRVNAIAKPNAVGIAPPPPGTRTGADVPFSLPQGADAGLLPGGFTGYSGNSIGSPPNMGNYRPGDKNAAQMGQRPNTAPPRAAPSGTGSAPKTPPKPAQTKPAPTRGGNRNLRSMSNDDLLRAMAGGK